MMDAYPNLVDDPPTPAGPRRTLSELYMNESTNPAICNTTSKKSQYELLSPVRCKQTMERTETTPPIMAQMFVKKCVRGTRSLSTFIMNGERSNTKNVPGNSETPKQRIRKNERHCKKGVCASGEAHVPGSADI